MREEKAVLLQDLETPVSGKPTLRVLFLSLILSSVFSFVIPYNDLYYLNSPLAGNLLPTNTVLVLVIIVCLWNPIFLRWFPDRAFKKEELGGMWAFLAIPSGIAMAGFWRYILPQIANLVYRATPQNRWDSLILPYAEPWLVVTDRATARGFYEGNGGVILWDGWLPPFSFWVPMAMGLVAASLFLAALIRKQWTDREHFTFPLIQLPYELSRPPEQQRLLPPLFFRRPFWIGFAASFLLHLTSGLNLYFPAVPAIRRSRMLGEYVTAFPLDAISGTYINIYPAGIGLTYFLTSEVAFSLWFFFVLERLQQVVFRYLGWTAFGMSATDFVQFQQVGAILGLLIIVLYAASGHWVTVVKRSVGLLPKETDRHEPMPYPVAFFGLLLVAFFLFFWLVGRGLSPLLAGTFIVMALGFYLATGWIAGNGGLLMVQMRILPHDIVWATIGSRTFSPKDIIASFLLQKAFTYDLRETLFPTLLNAWKISERVGLNLRWVTGWGILLIGIAIPVALWAWMKMTYTHGAITLESSTFHWHANVTYNQMVQAMDPGLEPNWVRMAGTGIGFLIFSGCLLARRYWIWFPLHPMGLIVCRGWAMENLWLMILMGWIIKGLVLRYSGLSGYESLKPFFLGLILTDLVFGGTLAVIGLRTRKSYGVLP
ncbi:MAG: hypothetical protein NZ959_02410 [Armatimonadetes bacterium]|nr:hypothetical protein [Armatimonadota bacterium]MDW8120975.1 DUF6785 family protein [Armatimonadota bacterium]